MSESDIDKQATTEESLEKMLTSEVGQTIIKNLLLALNNDKSV